MSFRTVREGKKENALDPPVAGEFYASPYGNQCR